MSDSATPMQKSQSRRDVAFGLIGVMVSIALWEIIVRTPMLTGVLPSLVDVFRAVVLSDDRNLFLNALLFTTRNAALGYIIGAGIGIALAILALLVVALRPGIVRLGAVVNATPVVALGPVLLATLDRNNISIAVAAFFVFFSVFITTLSGFAEASAAHHDLFSALGSDRRKRFRFLEWPVCLPTLASGLKVAAPAAVVGSIFGEWFGLDRGIGPLLINSMQNYDIASLWGGTLLAGSFSLLLFLMFTVIERKVADRFR
ncbi:ABC transporter permease [Pseudorhodoplanes sp.]|uniref:ABC transporter permease n=1 Tax=Pseudorhodoplanes sp. TaxID=1934341 RepID=UPI003D12D982